MINDFIRNLGFVSLQRFTHHKRVTKCVPLRHASPHLSFYVLYHLLYLRRGSNSRSSDSYSEAFPLSYEGINSSGQPLATHLREYREVLTYTLSLSLVRCELFGSLPGVEPES